MNRARVLTAALAPAVFLAAAVPAAAATKPAKPTISITAQSSATVHARGGSVTFSGTVADASSCVLTSKPATTTVTTSCNHLPTFTAPLNPLAKAVTYKVTVTANGAGKATASATVTQDPATVVEMWGDSMLYEDGPYVAAAIEAANPDAVTYVHAFPSTDICFWGDPTRSDGIPMMLKAHKPAVVILQLRGEGAAACAKGGDPTAGDYSAKGLAQVTTSYGAAIATLLKAKVARVEVVSLPVRNTSSKQLADDANMRNAIAAAVTAAAKASVTYLDPSPSLTGPDGLFTMTLPCTADELATPGHCSGPVVGGVASNTVRADDGIHICDVSWATLPWPPMGCPGSTYSPGGTRIGAYIAAPINAFLAG